MIPNAANDATGNIIGAGSDALILQMSEDPDGPAGVAGTDAEFTVNVDGQQIGGLQTVTALHALGQHETFTFKGNYAPGPHTVTVTFANNSGTPGDKLDPNDGGDRNLYVDSLAYDGTTVSSSTVPIYVSPGAPPNYPQGQWPSGNAQFTGTG